MGRVDFLHHLAKTILYLSRLSYREKLGLSLAVGPQVTAAALVALRDAEPQNSGAKSAACAELERVAASSGGAFSTPRGAVLPFGSMELAIKVGVGPTLPSGIASFIRGTSPFCPSLLSQSCSVPDITYLMGSTLSGTLVRTFLISFLASAAHATRVICL